MVQVPFEEVLGSLGMIYDAAMYSFFAGLP